MGDIRLGGSATTSPWQHKVLTKMMGFNFKILYKKGSDNNVADALSRATHQEEIVAVSVLQPIWLTELQETYLQDAELSELL